MLREEEDASKFIAESTVATIATLIPEGSMNPLIIPKKEIKAEVKTEIKTEPPPVDLDRMLMPPPQKPMGIEDFELDPSSVDLGKKNIGDTWH